MTIKITRTGGNTFEITDSVSAITVLISYETPVAYLAQGRTHRTKTRWSRSTENQIAKFERKHNWNHGSDILQEEIDNLLQEMIGSTRYTGKAVAVKLDRTIDTSGVDYDNHTEQGDANLVFPVVRR